MVNRDLRGLAYKIKGLAEDGQDRRVNTTLISFYAQATHLIHHKVERIVTLILYWGVKNHMNSPVDPEGPPMSSHLKDNIVTKHSGVNYQKLTNFLLKHEVIDHKTKDNIHHVSQIRNKVVHDFVPDKFEEEAIGYLDGTLETIEHLEELEEELEDQLKGN